MKTGVIVAAALALGIAIGWGETWNEFHGVAEDFEPYLAAELVSNSSATDDSNAPKVVVLNGEQFDFGVMERFSKRSHAFLFKNEGSVPLTLRVGETTCKCTVGELEKSEVQPGETVDVKLEWKVESPSRFFQQQAEVHTSDPSRPSIMLYVRGRVSQSVTILPDTIALGNITVDEGGSGSVRILSLRDEQFDLQSAEIVHASGSEHFELNAKRVEPTDADRAEFPGVKTAHLLSLRVKPGLPLGPINQTIRVVTTIPESQPIEIPVNGTVVSDISVLGPKEFYPDKNTLVWGVIPHGKGAEGTLHVLVKGPHREHVKISIGTIDPEGILDAEIGEPLESGTVTLYPLKVTIPTDTPAVNRLGSQQGKLARIVLETTHPQAKEVNIYVSFAVEG